MKLFKALPLLAVIGTANVSSAQTAPQDHTCDTAALQAAESHDIPPQIMLAITRVETGREIEGVLTPWPWTVNHAGSGHWFNTAEEATEFVEGALADGATNLDIGCFQLNLRWHAQGFDNLTAMFDPALNASYAAGFLAQLYSDKGNWVDTVAAYHSSTPEHAEAYIAKVETVLADMPTQAETPAKRANRFPLLQPGLAGRLASLVPQGGSAAPLFQGP